MFELKTSASFDSAHFLSGYQGKCANLHGHRWKIEVTVGKETLQEEGNYRDMVIDFGDVKKAVRDLADSYDHALIYEEGTLQRATVEAHLAEGFRLIAVPFRPTMKNCPPTVCLSAGWQCMKHRKTVLYTRCEP